MYTKYSVFFYNAVSKSSFPVSMMEMLPKYFLRSQVQPGFLPDLILRKKNGSKSNFLQHL